MPSPSTQLAERLGHRFRDPRLLEQALVHSSYVNEHPEQAVLANERLEFLGDSVLSLVISEALWERHPTEPEGLLTTRRAAIVSARGLAHIAGRYDLGAYLSLGQGAERAGERRRGSVLASTFEAVVAAVYLDGGLDAARALLLAACAEELEAELAPLSLKSPKSRLQELAYARHGRPPSYRVVTVDGPDHARVYEVEVAVQGAVVGHGSGRSRRDAETEAAAIALDTLTVGTTVGTPSADAPSADAPSAEPRAEDLALAGVREPG